MTGPLVTAGAGRAPGHQGPLALMGPDHPTYVAEEPEGSAGPSSQHRTRTTQSRVDPMNRSPHTYLLIGLVVVGAGLLFSGTGVGWLFLLWPLACLAMMAAMMWGMGTIGRSSGPGEHTHEDGKTHSHP